MPRRNVFVVRDGRITQVRPIEGPIFGVVYFTAPDEQTLAKFLMPGLCRYILDTEICDVKPGRRYQFSFQSGHHYAAWEFKGIKVCRLKPYDSHVLKVRLSREPIVLAYIRLKYHVVFGETHWYLNSTSIECLGNAE